MYSALSSNFLLGEFALERQSIIIIIINIIVIIIIIIIIIIVVVIVIIIIIYLCAIDGAISLQ